MTAPLPTLDGQALEKALLDLRKIEGKKQSISCPDGLEGCLVAHFVLVPGPIETAIRAALPAPSAATPQPVADAAGLVTCPACGGSGLSGAKDPVTLNDIACPTCRATGKVGAVTIE